MIEYIINKYDYKEIKLSSTKLTNDEIKYLSYNYLKNNFIYQSGTKFTLFEHDKKPIGYMIMNEGKQKANKQKRTVPKLEYISLSDPDKNELMISEKHILNGIIDSIKSKNLKINKIYISPYYNYSETQKKKPENNFIYTYILYNKLNKLSKGNTIGGNTTYINNELIPLWDKAIDLYTSQKWDEAIKAYKKCNK